MKRPSEGLILAMVVVVLAGCFPIELDVSKDGRVLIARQEGFFALDTATGEVAKLAGAAGGKPAFALWAPDGKSFVAVTEGEGAMMGTAHTFTLISPATGSSRVLLSVSNATYAQLSPDGKRLAVTRMADQSREPLDEQLPELHIVNVAEGTGKVIATNISVLNRWVPDAASLLVFQIQAKEADNYRGTLSAVAASSGEAKVLPDAIGTKDVFFDLSPDGNKVLFTAMAAAPAGQKPGAASDEESLFLLDIDSGLVRRVSGAVSYAIWSPAGTKVLLGTGAEDGLLTLMVADADLGTSKKIAADGADEVGGGLGASATVYPAWLNDDTVVYLARRAVYGTAGKNLELVTIGADGQGRKVLQARVDAAAIESAE